MLWILSIVKPFANPTQEQVLNLTGAAGEAIQGNTTLKRRKSLPCCLT